MAQRKAGDMILFFEKYSIIQVLYLFRSVKRAENIYFHYVPFSNQKQHPVLRKAVRKAIFFINRKTKVAAIDIKVVDDHYWAVNKKVIEFVECLAPEIEKSIVFRMITQRIAKDGNILKCYKTFLADYIAKRCLFFSLAKSIACDDEQALWIIPASVENGFIQNKLFGSNVLDKNIPSGISSINIAADLARKLAFLLMLTLLPVGFIVLKLKRLTLTRNIAKRYDVAMPVVWGFHEGDNLVTGVNNPYEDDYLYGERIKPGQVIHIFNYWRHNPKIEERFKSIMDKKGIPYIDKKEYKVTPRMLFKALKIQLSLLFGLSINGFYLSEKSYLLLTGCKVIRYILDTYLELENVNSLVFFSKIDYDPSHIVHTVIANSLGRKTVGIQHAASPYDLPQLCYAHFDNYVVFADMYIEEYAPYWQKIRLSKTGRETLDFVINILHDDKKIGELKKKMEDRFIAKKFTVVFALSGDNPNISARSWDNAYEGLSRLKELDIDFNLFLRFRESNYGYMRNFEKIAESDKRIIIDHKYFTTYELMALCDLFIGCATSFTLNEAIATKARVFTFDLDGRAKYLYRDYGKDFVISKSEDFVRVFNGLKDGFKDFDCNWELFKKKSNFNYDGKNHQRIQQAVYDTLEEARKMECLCAE